MRHNDARTIEKNSNCQIESPSPSHWLPFKSVIIVIPVVVVVVVVFNSNKVGFYYT